MKGSGRFLSRVLQLPACILHNPGVFEIIHTLNPSDRGELEITDVNNEYIRKGEMSYSMLEGYWSDAVRYESLFRASEIVKTRIRNNGN